MKNIKSLPFVALLFAASSLFAQDAFVSDPIPDNQMIEPCPTGRLFASSSDTVGSIPDFPASTSGSKTDLPPILNQKEWVLVPYVGYDLQQHTIGEGAAALYGVNSNLWTGFRVEHWKDQDLMAGVQGQLQANISVQGIEAHPFIVTTIGMGKNSLYGSGGTGLYVDFAYWQWGQKRASLGVIGDVEHYVMGTKNGDRAYGGVKFYLSF